MAAGRLDYGKSCLCRVSIVVEDGGCGIDVDDEGGVALAEPVEQPECGLVTGVEQLHPGGNRFIQKVCNQF